MRFLEMKMNKILIFFLIPTTIISCTTIEKVGLVKSVTVSCCPCPNDLNFSNGELEILKNRVEQGDPEAARAIWDHFILCLHDEENGEIWLRKAASLKQPQAQRWIGELIKTYDKPYLDFGDTKEKALFSLFSESCTSGNREACYELALIYEKGSAQIQDFKKARAYMRKCANLGDRTCWDNLGEYYFEGIGGPIDYKEAYFWVSLEALCVHPESIAGKKIWAFRDTIVENIPNLRDFISLWALIDKYIENIENKSYDIYFDRCGGIAVKDDVYSDCIQKVTTKDLLHRKEIKNTHNL